MHLRIHPSLSRRLLPTVAAALCGATILLASVTFADEVPAESSRKVKCVTMRSDLYHYDFEQQSYFRSSLRASRCCSRTVVGTTAKRRCTASVTTETCADTYESCEVQHRQGAPSQVRRISKGKYRIQLPTGGSVVATATNPDRPTSTCKSSSRTDSISGVHSTCRSTGEGFRAKTTYVHDIPVSDPPYETMFFQTQDEAVQNATYLPYCSGCYFFDVQVSDGSDSDSE